MGFHEQLPGLYLGWLAVILLPLAGCRDSECGRCGPPLGHPTVDRFELIRDADHEALFTLAGGLSR